MRDAPLSQGESPNSINVRLGSLEDARAENGGVRFTPQSRHYSAWASMSAKCQKQTFTRSRLLRVEGHR
jgi:hypothetical protein